MRLDCCGKIRIFNRTIESEFFPRKIRSSSTLFLARRLSHISDMFLFFSKYRWVNVVLFCSIMYMSCMLTSSSRTEAPAARRPLARCSPVVLTRNAAQVSALCCFCVQGPKPDIEIIASLQLSTLTFSSVFLFLHKFSVHVFYRKTFLHVEKL